MRGFEINNGDLVITNSTFEGFGSWAIQVNGDINGNATVDGCTFNGCTSGIFKGGIKGDPSTSGTVEGTFTFTNNTLDDQCKGHDGKATAFFGGNLAANNVASGNTLGGLAWTPDSACGFGK